MADEEKKPLKNFKFESLKTIEGDLTADEIRKLYLRKKSEIKENVAYNNQRLKTLKEQKAAEREEFDSQKNELGRDPRIFYTKMKQRRDSEVAFLERSYENKNDPSYLKRLAEIEQIYAHALDNDLLDKDQDAYVNKVMDAIEAKTAEISTKLKSEESRVKLENNKLANQDKNISEQQKILETNPELYAKLFAVKSWSATHDDPLNDPVSSIKLDAKKQPCLAIILQDARFPGGFVISDGKINFSQDVIDNMTLDTMRYIIDYLDRRGIKGIELPSGIDKKLEELYTKGMEANRAAQDAEWDKYNTGQAAGAEEVARPEQNNEPASEGHAAPMLENVMPRDFSDNPPTDHEEITLGAQKSKADYKKLYANIDDWIFDVGGMNKQEMWNGFRSYKLSGGWDCWTVYDEGNFNNPDLDGKMDKDGGIKVKYNFKIYARQRDDGSLEVRYAMPKGKPINQGYANGVIRMLKKCGLTHVNFPEAGGHLPEEDEGLFRIACAGNGLVPMLDNLSENKVNKMLDEAKNKLSAKDLLNYKKKLADWMAECIEKEGAVFEDHKNASLITNLRGEYQGQPFRDMYEKGGGIRSKLMEIVKNNEDNNGGDGKYSGAIKIAAAADAVAMCFEIYIDNHEKTLQDMLSDPRLSASPFNKEEIYNRMQENLNSLTPPMPFAADKKVRDLKPREMAAFYEALTLGNERKYAQEFDNEIIKAAQEEDAGLRPSTDNVIKNNILNKAKNHFSSVSSNLEEDYNVKKIYLPNLGAPQHDFIHNRDRLVAEGKMKARKPKKNSRYHDYDDEDEFEI